MSADESHQTHSTTPLHQLAFILQQLADELLLNKIGVGLSQARILGALHKSDPISQRNIATHLGQTEANISRQLQNMKSEGLVNVAKNKKDGRQRDVTLTTRGIHKKEQAEKLLVDQQTELLKLLVGNSEVKEFIATTERLLIALSVESHRGQKLFGAK